MKHFGDNFIPVIGVTLYLMAVKAFPPLLGIALIIVFLACSVYLSCYLNRQLSIRKRVKRVVPFHAAPTKKVVRSTVYR